MLNILLLDKKYIAYTLSLRNILGRFLCSLKPFTVHIDGAQIKVKPRSADLFTIYEVFRDQGYLPRINTALEKVDTVVDFGANIGIYSIWATLVFRPGVVYAVEMESRCYRRLVENIALNQMQATIKPIQAAIYNRTGYVGARRMVGSEFYAIQPGGRTLSLPSVSFGDFITSTSIRMIDLLKIDIEGGEKYLLTEDNKGLFKERVRYVLLETHSLNDFKFDRCLSYFRSLGFKTDVSPTPYVIDKNFLIDAWNPSI